MEAGFSLLELLYVIAIITIVAGLAIPGLMSSKKAAYEAAAITYLRAWTDAQELYKLRTGTYADAPGLLVAAGYIEDPDPVKFGYIFALSGVSNQLWAGTASPRDPGTTGDRYFFIDVSGVLRAATGGPADASSPVLNNE